MFGSTRRSRSFSARVALGPVSGALVVAQAAGAPTVQWDYPGRLRIAQAVNFFETPMVNLEHIDPPVDTVVESMWRLMVETASQPMLVVPSIDNLRDRTRMVSSDFRFKLDETSG